MFKNTQRSMQKKSRLDYSKIVLIKDHDYLDNTRAVVDQDEYKETVTHLPIIVSDVIDYVLKYKNHVNGTAPLHPKEFERKYKFSTLPYFHDVLEI